MNLAPWHVQDWQRLLTRRAQDRLAHALLLSGAAGLGKREFADAFVAALEHELFSGEHYVIASGKGHSLAETYRLISEAGAATTGRRVEIRHVAEPADLHPIERRNFVGNSSLYQQRTGWRPRISLPEGIGRFFAAESSRLSVAR